MGEMLKKQKVKKPFYKRGWFIAFAVIMILGAIGSGSDDTDPASDSNAVTTTESEVSKSTTAPETTEEEIDANIQAIMETMKLTKEESQAVFDNLNSVGLTSIKDIQMGAGTGVDELQSFVANCDGRTAIVTIEKRLTYYIGIGSIDLYDSSAGGVLDTIDNYVMSDTDMFKFINLAEDYVTQILKAPSTAEFPGQIMELDQWRVARYQDVVTVMSYVDSQNSFGAMIRSEFGIQMSFTTGEVLYLVFDDEVVTGTMQPMSKSK